MWQIRVKNGKQIINLGVPMTWAEAVYWLERVRQMNEWCQLKRVR